MLSSPAGTGISGVPQLRVGLCSFGSHLPYTPTVNPSSVMSPAGSSQAEEQQYLDKLKQLSKYIEPLRRMINKIDKNEGRSRAGEMRGPGQAHSDPILVSPDLFQTEKRT